MLLGDAVTDHDDPISIFKEKIFALNLWSHTRESQNYKDAAYCGFHD
jgi:hypothetical protein